MALMNASVELDNQLYRHDQVLREYRQMMGASHPQRETPSFLQSLAVDGAGQHPTEDGASSVGSMWDDDDVHISGAPRSKKPVHEQLLERGKLYEQRREALREDFIRREMENVRPKPEISARAVKKFAQNPRDPSKAIYERFAEQEEYRKQQALRARAAGVDEEPKYTFRPHITKRARSATSRVQSPRASRTKPGGGRGGGEMWQSKRDAKLEKLRSSQLLDELSEVKDAPTINERSERLVERRRARDRAVHGPSRGPHYTHADSLLERDRLSKLQRWERYRERMEDEQPGNPKITPFAAQMDRSHLGNVTERLYDQSFEREERRSMLSSRHSDLGECYHSPRITAHAAAIRRGMPVEDDLLGRHDRSRREKDEHMSALINRERDLHVPVINPISDEIAARLPHTPRERLYSNKTDYSRLRQEHLAAGQQPPGGQQQSMQNSQSNLPAARRSAGKRSRSAPATGADTDNSFYRRIELRRDQTDRKMRALRQDAEERALKECTFQPRANLSPGSARRLSKGGTVHQRAAKWQQRREEKLRDERARRDEEETRNCTFIPNKHRIEAATPAQQLTTPHSSAHPSALPPAVAVEDNPAWEGPPDTALYGGSGRAWGYDEFVERHREARRQQMERDEGTFMTGRGWRNEATVPQEFALGRRDQGRVGVNALRKPLSPPRVGPSQGYSEEPSPAAEQAHPSFPSQGLFSSHGQAVLQSVASGVPWESRPSQPAPAALPVPDEEDWMRRH
eukprot:Hpha_TRINITY_DN16639_c1_g1::TRINITY_DN16639_c1_g1_i1::g.183604::m.183604